jgi:hypothetical protein
MLRGRGEEIADREAAGKGKEWNLISAFFIAGKEPKNTKWQHAVLAPLRDPLQPSFCVLAKLLTFAFKIKEFCVVVQL